MLKFLAVLIVLYVDASEVPKQFSCFCYLNVDSGFVGYFTSLDFLLVYMYWTRVVPPLFYYY